MKKLLLILVLTALLTIALIGYCTTYTSQYPTQDGDHVKATSEYTPYFYAYFGTNPELSLTGTQDYNSWLAEGTVKTDVRFHIDLGEGKVIRRIYYENSHHEGGNTNRGVKNFTFWGSNTEASFLELTYGTDTGWTELTVAQNTFDEHTESDVADPKYIVVTNSTAYQYYAFKIVDAHGGVDAWAVGFRRVELQTEDAVEANVMFMFSNF